MNQMMEPIKLKFQVSNKHSVLLLDEATGLSAKKPASTGTTADVVGEGGLDIEAEQLYLQKLRESCVLTDGENPARSVVVPAGSAADQTQLATDLAAYFKSNPEVSV